MSFFTSLIILLLLALIQSFLQLTPGVFAIFYHQALGKKSKRFADDLSLYYILGVEFFSALLFLFVYATVFIIFAYQDNFISGLFTWIMSGIFFVEGFFILFGYYRHKKGSELFINRRTAKALLVRAANIKKRSDVFILGFITSSLETIFTLPLYIILAAGTMQLTTFPRYPIVIIYIIITVLPIFVVHALYRLGHNLADIERFRVRNKLLFKIALSLCYILIAIILIFIGMN